MAVANRFEDKDDVKSICDYTYLMLYNCKNIEIEKNMFNFLAGVCLENQ